MGQWEHEWETEEPTSRTPSGTTWGDKNRGSVCLHVYVGFVLVPSGAKAIGNP
jgi:hypothetical protein